MASVDYTYFTDADMPQENMKDWHTCLKAKQISLLKKKKKTVSSATHTYLFLLVWCFVFLHQGPVPSSYMNVCLYLYVHILYKYIMSVLWLFTEKGFVVHWLASMPPPCFSSTRMYHSVSFYTSASVTIHLHVTPLLTLHSVLFHQMAESAELQLSILTQRTKFRTCSLCINPLKPT